MARIVEEVFYNGSKERIDRLGLGPLVEEIRSALTGFQLLVKEKKDSNGGAAVRKLIDARFLAAGDWKKVAAGGVDWTKCRKTGAARVCLGVEVQVSARSDLLVMDIIHLRKELTTGAIDLGVLVVPSDRLSQFLTDRAPSMADAKRHMMEAKVDDLPIVILALEHDGPGPALAKQKKRK